MKKWVSFLATGLTFLFAFATQAQGIKTETVTYNGVKYPAYTRILDLPDDQVMDVVKATFAERGIKGTEKKGYLIYRSVVLPAINMHESHDVFFKVEREGKKSENKSKLYAIVTRPGAIPDEKPEKGTKNDATGVVLAAGGYAIFDATNPHYENQAYLNAVKLQEEEVRKAEKKLKELQDEKVQMDKAFDKLQKDMAQNQKDTEAQMKEVERVRLELEARKKAKPGADKQ